MADGTGAVKRLTTSAVVQHAYSWSTDGQQLLFYESGIDGLELGVLSLADEPTAEALLKTSRETINPALSPDGRWVAYQLTVRPGEFEIYVQPFPATGAGRWPVSTDGGRQPWWGPEGDELFYWGQNNMMVVPVETEPTFAPGKPEVLFDISEYEYRFGRNYAVTPDGERFLMVKPDESSQGNVNVVLNWLDELERPVPTN